MKIRLSRYERISAKGIGWSHLPFTAKHTPWYYKINGIYICSPFYVYFLTFYGEDRFWSKAKSNLSDGDILGV